MTDHATLIAAVRPQLLRFARSQLRSDAWAEDAVSETVLAAVERPEAFHERSQLKTWLMTVRAPGTRSQNHRAWRQSAPVVN